MLTLVAGGGCWLESAPLAASSEAIWRETDCISSSLFLLLPAWYRLVYSCHYPLKKLSAIMMNVM